MDTPKKSVWIPPLGSLFGGRDEDRVQMNPATAYRRAESKTQARILTTAASLLAVFALIVYGGNFIQKTPQQTSVGAMVNIPDAVQGIVTDVDYPAGSFFVGVEESTDPDIAGGQDLWSVVLPPGASFDGQNDVLKTCFSVSDFRSISGAISAPCQDIVAVGRSVIVQFVVVDVPRGTMTAKKIYGQAK